MGVYPCVCIRTYTRAAPPRWNPRTLQEEEEEGRPEPPADPPPTDNDNAPSRIHYNTTVS